MKELLTSRPGLLITVIGVGGCGCNTINMLHENNLSSMVNLIAVNTDLAVLNHSTVESKILIGQNLTNGYGAGADPAIGLKAAEESEEVLKAAIEDSDIVIITAGFGGGTGTGASPFIAKLARDLDINCLAVVTLPFGSESKMRMDYATAGIELIKEPAQAYITLSNDLLLKGLGENIGLFSAFKQSNDVLNNLLTALVQMLTQTGHMNVDINDFARILSFEGESVLGVGKAETEEDAFAALEQALNNPLVSAENIDSAQGIIIHICCKKDDIKLSTYDGLVNNVRKKLKHDSALIVAGVSLDPELTTELTILIIASGISTKALPNQKSPTALNELGESYVGDDLSFISDHEHLEFLTNSPSFTDIPAIVRKLQRLNQSI
ncbi:cell division protein FtsZ [Colwellia hornerae]|uniref:Cell division protein FtsZ n=1 Tax=Colwellia hornerae TaxID=89402 RepID=A0A5C6Q987_9GAMM|nr:cell division protein FtsZ [Colwellia hornerae]TWX50218.1 cell division protein FtsZ [Colwellia hornerae]TWX56115.1 cell division protein FtsZ [Colwellia hornerae]TWX65137.1 cell division protein FtsZ [Colwellia hornerae]